MAFIAKQRYKLDIAPKGGWVIVYASQHDDGAREIEFAITNQGNAFSIPASINVSVQGIKSNKSYFSHSCSYSGNIVTMALADDMTDIVGKAICVLKFTNSSQQKLATAKFILNVDSDSSSEGIIIDTEAEEIFNQMLDEIRAQAASVSADIAELQSMVGSPLVASTVSAMTNHNKIYVYTGSESGYTNGNWYYWNGSAWTSGGVYNAVAFETDTTLTQSGQAADAKVVGDEISDVKEELSDLNGGTINLLNPADFQQGKYIVNGGGLSDNANLTASGFFHVSGNTTYYFYCSDTYKVRVCFYTGKSEEGYINQSLIEITSRTATTFVTPAGAKYARISTNKNMILDMGIYATDIRHYIPYKLLLADGIGIDNQLDPTLADSKKASPADVVGEIKKHVVFPEKCIKYGDSGMIINERLNTVNGSIVTNSSGQTRTDYIPVAVGDYLQTCAIRTICLYGDEFEYLGYINLWTVNDDVEPPASWSGNYRSNITRIEAVNGVEPKYIRCWGAYTSYPPAVTILDNKPYEVLNLADSIFGNNEKPWDLGTYIQNITGLKSANCGYGGTTARVISSGNMSPLGLPSIVDCIVAEDFSALQTPAYWASVSEYMYAVPTLLFSMIDFSKIKIITIAYGTNDWNSNTPLDNSENSLDTSTYCGGLRYAIEHLQAKYPNIIIMLFSPIYRYWSDSSDYSTVDRDSDSRTNTLGLKLTDYVDAMKSVADEYHLPYFDNYRNIGLNRYTASTWLRDGTHLIRTTGAAKLGHRVAREIETVY